MVRAILQKGRTKHGLVLPAEAQKKVNEVNDRGTLEKWLGDEAPGSPNVVKVPADPSAATLKGGPLTAPETNESLQQNVTDRDDITLETGVLTAEGNIVKGGQVHTTVSGGKPKNTPDALQLMEGVGEALEQHLYDAGYVTYEDIAAADKEELAKNIHGVSEDSAKGVIKQAKKYAKLKAKGKL